MPGRTCFDGSPVGVYFAVTFMVTHCWTLGSQPHPLIFRRSQFATSDTYLDPEILALRVLRHGFCVTIMLMSSAIPSFF